jgi:hypothetical protein
MVQPFFPESRFIPLSSPEGGIHLPTVTIDTAPPTAFLIKQPYQIVIFLKEK